MNVHRVDLIVVDDRAQARTGEGNLGARILALDVVGMHGGCIGILAEIVQAQKCRESDTSHAAHQRSFLSTDAVWENSLVAGQMQLLVLIRVIGFLEHGDIVRAALVQIGVLIGIHRINLHAANAEILTRDLAGAADVLHIRHSAAFAGQNQNFLKAGLCDGGHFLMDALIIQLGSLDLIMTVKSAVDAEVLAVIGDINRRKHADGITKMLSRLFLGFFCHFFQERLCCR